MSTVMRITQRFAPEQMTDLTGTHVERVPAVGTLVRKLSAPDSNY